MNVHEKSTLTQDEPEKVTGGASDLHDEEKCKYISHAGDSRCSNCIHYYHSFSMIICEKGHWSYFYPDR